MTFGEGTKDYLHDDGDATGNARDMRMFGEYLRSDIVQHTTATDMGMTPA